MIALLLALLLTLAPSTVSGRASWYPAPAGTAAAGPAVRVMLHPYHMGARLRVCVTGTTRCVRVVVRDVCLCRPPYVSQLRAIDLSAYDFARLAPLSRGVIKVTITEVP